MLSLTTRYISDRYLPDKAIDALDEAGSRVHITNIHVPVEIIDIENRIEETKKIKPRQLITRNLKKLRNSGILKESYRMTWNQKRKNGKKSQRFTEKP